MNDWRTGARTLGLLGAVGLTALMAPTVKGQAHAGDDLARVVQLFGGGSQIGVSVRDVDEEVAKTAKLASLAGVLIEAVREGSPAEKAGLRKGDVVIEFDGERVRSTRQFARLVQETPADRQVPAIVVRDGQRTTLTVQPRSTDAFSSFGDLHRFEGLRVFPAPAPPTPPSPPSPPVTPTPPRSEVFPRIERFFDFSSGRLGISVESLSDQLAEYFGTRRGVLVASVTDGSAAAKAGLKAGDVITGINGNAVESPSDLTRRVQRMEGGDEFTLEIVRDKKTMTLKGKLEPRQPQRWTAQTIV